MKIRLKSQVANFYGSASFWVTDSVVLCLEPPTITLLAHKKTCKFVSQVQDMRLIQDRFAANKKLKGLP
jgi:hypothetical protein